MEFSWSEEQLTLKEAVIRFARRELNSGLKERDWRGEFDVEGWKKCAEFGIHGLAMPERYGGSGNDALSVMLAMESLGYGCPDNGLLFALGAQMWSVQMPLLVFGSEIQKDQFLPGLISGRIIGAHAVTEPVAGSDAYALQTTAVREGSWYVLTGSKTYITNAPVADLFLVLATVDVSKGTSGLTAFLVEKGTPGVSVTRPLEKMGLRTSTIAEVVFDNCRVSAEQLLGNEGAGSAVFTSAMEWERVFILAPALGGMQRQLEQCIKHARLRRQFGKPIGKNEAVANKIVDMHMRLETARLLSYKTAWLKTAGRRLTHEPSEVKLHVSESWVQNSLEALQIHGAFGYMADSGIERDLRDSLASKIYSGTSEIQKVIIAGYLGL